MDPVVIVIISLFFVTIALFLFATYKIGNPKPTHDKK